MGRKIPSDALVTGGNSRRRKIESSDYEHWTVADLMEMLSEYDPEARIWIDDSWWGDEEEDYFIIRPIEMIHASDGEVFLG